MEYSDKQLKQTFENLVKADFDELEKAVYADTAENRKLGRVGQEYKRSKGKKDDTTANVKSEVKSELRKLSRGNVSSNKINEVTSNLKQIIKEKKLSLGEVSKEIIKMRDSSKNSQSSMFLQKLYNELNRDYHNYK